ncbi:MAG: hypothetical protein F9K48_09090 [Candidatus Brocadia sp.]|nr:MAG: hypothetical protein F9K48_09090 [Candidatus Brocadia sp.]
MNLYKNLGGDSGVHSFEIGPDCIKVQFLDGVNYTYNYAVTGMDHVERMKELAIFGQGLNSYINKYVRKLYAFKTN